MRILKLSELRHIYIANLEATEFANQKYRGEKLNLKLEKCKDYQGQLGFYPIEAGNFQSYLVFNSKMDICDAIRTRSM